MKSTLTRNDLEKWAASDLGFYTLDIDRFSTIFLAQVFQLQASRALNTQKLMDELQYLEGRCGTTCTGDAEVFKHQPLKGLFKKHFTDARFIRKNIGAHFGLDHGGKRNLDSLIHAAFADLGVRRQTIQRWVRHRNNDRCS